MVDIERLDLMIPSSPRLAELYNIRSHPQANIYTPRGLHNSKLDTQQWIREWRSRWQQYQFGYLVLIKKTDCSATGICGYGYRQLKQETILNLFYKLYPNFKGRGYACEAITAITNLVNYIDQETVKIIKTDKCN